MAQGPMLTTCTMRRSDSPGQRGPGPGLQRVAYGVRALVRFLVRFYCCSATRVLETNAHDDRTCSSNRLQWLPADSIMERPIGNKTACIVRGHSHRSCRLDHWLSFMFALRRIASLRVYG